MWAPCDKVGDAGLMDGFFLTCTIILKNNSYKMVVWKKKS